MKWYALGGAIGFAILALISIGSRGFVYGCLAAICLIVFVLKKE